MSFHTDGISLSLTARGWTKKIFYLLYRRFIKVAKENWGSKFAIFRTFYLLRYSNDDLKGDILVRLGVEWVWNVPLPR